MNMMYYHDFYSPFMVIGPVIHFVFWLFVIILVIKLIKRGRHGSWSEFGSHHSAMQILRERFAKGEISKEEYQERKSVLEQK